MAKSTSKTKRPEQPKHDLKLSFLDERNPDTKPPIPDDQAEQIMTAIEAFNQGRAVEMEACTEDSCSQKLDGIKGLLSQLGVDAVLVNSCRSSCQWFYSQGGGWQKECYFICSHKGNRIEGTIG